MKAKYLLTYLIVYCSLLPSFGQYNYSPPEKYLEDPFTAEAISDFNSNALRRSKNQPPIFKTVPRVGFVILLDSTKIFGRIELFGRCFNDLYGVTINSSEIGNKKWNKEYVFNKNSLLAFGLNDRSENMTPDLFVWNDLFPPNGTDTVALSKFIEATYGIDALIAIERPAKTPDGKAIKNMYQTTYYPKISHTCEVTRQDPGYVVTTSGERIEGYIQIKKIDGLVVEIRLAKKSKYKPEQLLEYGIREIDRSERFNETPSAFVWGARIPGSLSNLRSTKPVQGYLTLADGSELSGELKLKAQDQRILNISIKDDDGKSRTIPLDQVVTFGASGFPKDQSTNETQDGFEWKVKQSMATKNPDPAIEESKSVSGYVIKSEGKTINGSLVLLREYGFITQIKIKPSGEKWKVFAPHQLVKYGNSNPVDKSAFTPTSSNPMDMMRQARAMEAQEQMANPGASDFEGDDKTMRPAENNPCAMKLPNLPLASNTTINETSEEYFTWTMGSGTCGKHFEKSLPIPGYIKLKNGNKVKGMLQLKRMNTKLAKYYLGEFEIKNDEGKFTYTQEEVMSYGADAGGGDAIKPGDIVQGYTVSADPQLIKTFTTSGYETEPKSGYVQLTTGDVMIGLVSEVKRFSGRVDITLADLNGNEMKYKGDLLSHGYFDVVPFSEYPSSVYSLYTSTDVQILGGALSVGSVGGSGTGSGKYTDFATGYLRLIDGTLIEGEFASGIPGVTARGDGDEAEFTDGDICDVNKNTVQATNPVPPLNKFFNDRNERKLDYTANSELLDEIYEFKIKTKDGKKKYRNDLVKSYGAYGIYMSQLTKNGLVAYSDKKLNFYQGDITTKNGEKRQGWIAHIKSNNDKNPYYGVYFTSDQSEPVQVYPMDELSGVNQNIVDIEEYDPLEDDFLAMKEMSSTFDSNPNGLLVDNVGNKRTGNITLEIPPKLWYATSIIFTDGEGVQEIFDKDNPLEMVEFTKQDSSYKYIMYRGVFVQVLKESGPLFYFRNPFPSIEKNSGKFLNSLIDNLVQKGMGELAENMGQKMAEKGDVQSGMELSNFINDIGAAGAIDLGMYLKEYLVYYKTIDRAYITIRKDMGIYTNFAEFEDLLNGSIAYLNLSRQEIKELGEIEDYETGEGLEPTLDFLSRSLGAN